MKTHFTKIAALALTLILALSLFAGCGAKAPAEKESVVVFAAASLKETLTALGDQYMAQNEAVELIFNFDSSGTLKTQIEEGAACDVFISAGQKQMNALDKAKEGADFVAEGSRFDILENKVVLAVPEGNPAGVESFDALRDGLTDGSLLLAMGNSDVPVGQYTLKIFDFYGLNEQELADSQVITYGSNVKEVTTQVKEAAVDCGVIYQTDAFSAGLTVVDTATAEMCGQVIYPAAVMKSGAHTEAGQAFLDFLTTDAADAEFEKVGFTPIA